MKNGDDDNPAFLKAIEEAVGESVERNSPSFTLDERIKAGTRRHALDAPKELFEKFVPEAFSLAFVPTVGVVELLGRRFAKTDALHGRRGSR